MNTKKNSNDNGLKHIKMLFINSYYIKIKYSWSFLEDVREPTHYFKNQLIKGKDHPVSPTKTVPQDNQIGSDGKVPFI